MSVAERTRAAVRREPFLLDALAAGVVNYSAAARYLDVEGDQESIATALRRFAGELEDATPGASRASVRLLRGLSLHEEPPDDDGLLAVGGQWLVEGDDLAALRASGDLDAGALERVLGTLRAASVDVRAAGALPEGLVVAVPKRQGADALRVVEDVL